MSSLADGEISPREIYSVNTKIVIIFFNLHDVMKTVGRAKILQEGLAS